MPGASAAVPHDAPGRSPPRARAATRAPAAAAIASLYQHWQQAGEVLEQLAHCLSRCDPDEGMPALARVTTSLLIADALVEVVARAGADAAPTAQAIRGQLLTEILPWLDAVRGHLPEAASQLSSYPRTRRTCIPRRLKC